MSAFVYDEAMSEVASGTINLSTDTLKWVLVTSSYAAAKTDTSLTPVAAAEISATNYTGGFGGSGRKSAPRTINKDTVNNRVDVVFAGNATWTALGNPTNATIAAAVLVKETGGSDAASKPIAYFGLAPAVTTNGSDFSLTVDGTDGNIRFTL